MSLILKKEEGVNNFEPLEAGSHAAICIQILDFGPQRVEWKGEIKEQNKIRLVFEVPSERIEYEKDGEQVEGPMLIGKTVTASMDNRSTLRRFLVSWRGRDFTPEEEAGFDLRDILGKPCMISVSHKSFEHDGLNTTYANIDSISRLMKGMTVPEPENELLMFDFDDHTQDQFDALPEWQREKVAAGKALSQIRSDQNKRPAKSVDVPEDDIPF